MINNSITLILLMCHFLGDYHFQSEELSDAKDKESKALMKHLLIHGLLLLVTLIPVWDISILPIFITVWLSHIIIDVVKVGVQKRWPILHKIQKSTIYIIDQILHIGTILILSMYVFPETNQVNLFVPTYILKWILLTVLITKPANITFKILFNQYQNYSGMNTNDPTVPGAGAMIGNLERILSAIFLSLNALSSIGLIYTAKSIARFKLIEENQGFAEYYLIGTLFSILFVVVSYFLIF